MIWSNFLKLAIMSLGLLTGVRSLEFKDFVQKYGKTYDSPQEYFHRKDIFTKNLLKINLHNEDEENSYSLEMNQYGDLEWHEFSLPRVGHGKHSVNYPVNVGKIENNELPSSFDWSEVGAVSSIKNQGSCGSCWAFSTTGALEGLNFINSGEMIPLSEEQLVECSKLNSGCNGGLMELGFDYVKKHGICSEEDYPYTSGTGSSSSCKKECKSVFTITGYENVPTQNETALQLALYKQPISIALEADKTVFQFYSEGVMDKPGCGTNLDHGVLLVGWGTLDGKSYWKVKNSWGEEWGKDGYILLARDTEDPSGQCGLALQASYPV